MTVPAHLQRRLQEKLGADAAKDLMRLLDRMDPLVVAMADVRGDVRDINARIKELEATLVGRFDTALERGLREQTRFFFLAWAVILATIIGLYARAS